MSEILNRFKNFATKKFSGAREPQTSGADENQVIQPLDRNEHFRQKSTGKLIFLHSQPSKENYFRLKAIEVVNAEIERLAKRPEKTIEKSSSDETTGLFGEAENKDAEIMAQNQRTIDYNLESEKEKYIEETAKGLQELYESKQRGIIRREKINRSQELIEQILTLIKPIIEELEKNGIQVEISKLIDKIGPTEEAPYKFALGVEMVDQKEVTPAHETGDLVLEETWYTYFNVNALILKLVVHKENRDHIDILETTFMPLQEYVPYTKEELKRMYPELNLTPEETISKDSIEISISVSRDRYNDFSTDVRSSLITNDLKTCVTKFREAVVEAIRVYKLYK